VQTILNNIVEEPDVAPFLSRNGHVLKADHLTPIVLSEARQREEKAPEQAALIYLGLIFKSLRADNHHDLSLALKSVAHLPLAVSFVKALLGCARHEKFGGIECGALQIFLKAVVAQNFSDNIKTYFEDISSNIPLFTIIDDPQNEREGSHLSLPKSRWVVTEGAPINVMGQGRPDVDPEIIFYGSSANASKLRESAVRCSASGRLGSFTNAEALRIRAYSQSEEALSRHSANVARALVAGIADTLGKDEALAWVAALELPIDDLIFGATQDFWSLLQHLRDNPRPNDTILVGNTDFAMAFYAGLHSSSYSENFRVVMPDCGFQPSADPCELLYQIVHLAFAHHGYGHEETIRHNILAALAAAGTHKLGPESAAGSALLIGRNFDRNYGTDLIELGRELRKQRRVVFMPTAGQTIKGRVTSLVDSLTSDWYDRIVLSPAVNLWSSAIKPYANGGGNLLASLIDLAIRHGSLNLTDMALILAARDRLEKFFSSKIYNYIQSGAETAQAVVAINPSHIALLPGRDFIARVAAMVSRKAGIPSFDAQTVFVGPRSRYKPTVADIQFVIETHSQGLFTSYFHLPIEKTALTGCSKVGLVQEQARALDRDAVRQSIKMQDKFLLVFAGSPFLDEDKPILLVIADILNDWPDALLGVRLHPTADEAYGVFCEQLNRTNPNISILKKLDLAQTMTVSDILITRFSNVGLESALLERDVIACNFSDAPPPISLDHMGVATAAFSQEELLACITDFRSKGPRWNELQRSRAAYLAKNGQLIHGPASANMRRVIEAHIAARRPV
jgi:hypothetical protein